LDVVKEIDLNNTRIEIEIEKHKEDIE